MMTYNPTVSKIIGMICRRGEDFQVQPLLDLCLESPSAYGKLQLGINKKTGFGGQFSMDFSHRYSSGIAGITVMYMSTYICS